MYVPSLQAGSAARVAFLHSNAMNRREAVPDLLHNPVWLSSWRLVMSRLRSFHVCMVQMEDLEQTVGDLTSRSTHNAVRIEQMNAHLQALGACCRPVLP